MQEGFVAVEASVEHITRTLITSARMIYFLILSTIAAVHVNGNAFDDVKTIMTKCNDGVEPKDELVTDFLYPKPSEEFKCLQTCVSKELGAMVDGKFKVEVCVELIKKFYPDNLLLLEKGPAMLQLCYNETESDDECEYTFKMITCIMKGRDLILGEAR